jgi:hypothetical protein
MACLMQRAHLPVRPPVGSSTAGRAATRSEGFSSISRGSKRPLHEKCIMCVQYALLLLLLLLLGPEAVFKDAVECACFRPCVLLSTACICSQGPCLLSTPATALCMHGTLLMPM